MEELLKEIRDAIKDRQLIRILAFLSALCAVFAIALFIVFCIFARHVDEIGSRIDPKNPQFCVTHGYYADPGQPQKSGLRMLRVSDGGFLLVAPVQPEIPKQPLEKPLPEKP